MAIFRNYTIAKEAAIPSRVIERAIIIENLIIAKWDFKKCVNLKSESKGPDFKITRKYHGEN